MIILMILKDPIWPKFKMAATIGSPKFTQNSGFDSLTFHSCIVMSSMVIKCRSRNTEKIYTTMLNNPKWLKFKMDAKVGTPEFT